MKLNAYATYDTAAAVYSRPFFANSDGEVMRSFQDIATDADHPIGAHPEDYSLHRIGSYNDQTAKLEPESPECLATGLEMVALSRDVKREQIRELDLNIASPGGTS